MSVNCTTHNTNTNYSNCTNNSKGDSPPEVQWHFFAFIVIMAIVCIFCNGIIVAVFIVEKSIRNHPNIFVISLACADLVLGIVETPLYLVNASPDVDLPYFYISFDISMFSAAIFSCTLLSIERALKIKFPYWYVNNVTTSRIKKVVLLGWIAAILVGSLSLTRGENSNSIRYVLFISIFIYVLPVLAITVSYTSIFLVAHKHTKSIRRQNSGIAGQQTRIRISEVKTAWRLGVFIIVYVICWTPHFINLWWRVLLEHDLLEHNMPLAFAVAGPTLPIVNAVINPFLYALFNPAFRKGIAKLYKRKKQASNYMESIPRNEISTRQTNITNSPSVSRIVSSHSLPSMELREPSLTPADLRSVHLIACKKMSILSQAESELLNNEHDNNRCYFFETSL